MRLIYIGKEREYTAKYLYYFAMLHLPVYADWDDVNSFTATDSCNTCFLHKNRKFILKAKNALHIEMIRMLTSKSIKLDRSQFKLSARVM